MPYLMCPGCKNLHPLGTGCTHCAQGARKWASKNTRTKGRYDHAWRKARAQAIAEQPWCSHCGSKTDLTGDHITPLSKGGTNTRDNVRVLCRSCNSRRGNKI